MELSALHSLAPSLAIQIRCGIHKEGGEGGSGRGGEESREEEREEREDEGGREGGTVVGLLPVLLKYMSY